MKERKPNQNIAPLWWIAYGVLCGLAAAGLILVLTATPRGAPVELTRAPSFQAAAVIPMAAATRTPVPTSGPVILNINTATVQDFQKLPNIGPATAQAIVTYRERNGGFTSLDQLLNVSGIGPKTFEGLLGMITLETE